MTFLAKAVLGLGVVLLTTSLSWGQVSPQRQALCAACHGADGNSQIKGIPSLAAQPKLFLENSLIMMREGMREVPAMKGMLDGVTDDEVIELAKFYAALPLAKPPVDRHADLFIKGEQLANGMRCGICHLPSYVGREQMPRLAGQREDYLLHSLLQFKNNQAVGRDSNMAASVYGVADADLQALSHYLSRLLPD
jgi:cytochrome c553